MDEVVLFRFGEPRDSSSHSLHSSLKVLSLAVVFPEVPHIVQPLGNPVVRPQPLFTKTVMRFRKKADGVPVLEPRLIEF